MTGADVVIACDESGFSGTNLLRSTEPVITHASTDLPPDEAFALIATLRTEFRLSPHELKSGQFLRQPGAGPAAEWFLGQLRGRAQVHLIDKEFVLVTRIIDLLLAEPSYLAGTHLTSTTRSEATAVYRSAHPTGTPWQRFLAAFEGLTDVPDAPEISRRLADQLADVLSP